jgi:hypothetical protein
MFVEQQYLDFDNYDEPFQVQTKVLKKSPVFEIKELSPG